MKKLLSLSIVGAGNVASHLAQALYNKKVRIDYILSRRKSSSASLAKQVQAKSTTSYDKLLQSDVIIVAVNDDVIPSISNHITEAGSYKGIVAHTSGSVSTKSFKNKIENYGSFYPLQSFNKDKELNIKLVPFCIYGNNESSQKTLTHLANKISNVVYPINDEQRASLHLAAVFANNFGNHMLTLAEQLCNQNQVSFDILKPLIIETFSRLQTANPSNLQTGPAMRNDKKVISKHKSILKKDPDLHKIYSILTDHIKKSYS